MASDPLKPVMLFSRIWYVLWEEPPVSCTSSALYFCWNKNVSREDGHPDPAGQSPYEEGLFIGHCCSHVLNRNVPSPPRWQLSIPVPWGYDVTKQVNHHLGESFQGFPSLLSSSFSLCSCHQDVTTQISERPQPKQASTGLSAQWMAHSGDLLL